MKPKSFFVVAFAAWITAISAHAAQAAFVSEWNLEEAYRSADLVFFGKVTKAQSQPNRSGPSENIDYYFDVLASVKGECPKSTHAPYEGATVQGNLIEAGEFCIVFVKKDKIGLRLLNNGRPWISLGSHYRPPSELPKQGEQAVIRYILGSLNAKDVETSIQNIQLLAEVDDSSIVGVLRTLLSTDNSILKGEVFAGLLAKKDWSVLEEAVKYVIAQSNNAAGIRDDTQASILNIVSALMNIQDREMGGKIIPLMKVQNGAVRKMVAEILVRLRRPEVVPFLIEQLESTDMEAKYNAVRLLGRFAGKLRFDGSLVTTDSSFVPTKEEFSKNEKTYIGRWKEWGFKQAEEIPKK